MTVLVFGSNGQVGSEVRAYAERKQLPLVALDRATCDVTSFATMQQMFQRHNPSAIINCAAYTAVDKAESEPELVFANNADAAENMARLCAERDIPLIHLSTDYVFDGSKKSAYVETDPVQALNVYGQSKLQAEQKIQQRLEKHIILRVSWLFGEYGNNFVKTILRLGQSKEALRIVSDQFGRPTYAADIAQTIFCVLEKMNAGNHAWGIYHYTGATTTTWYDLACEILATSPLKNQFITKSITPIATCDYPTPATRPLNSQLNCDKISEVFDIKAADWRVGLQHVLKVLS